MDLVILTPVEVEYNIIRESFRDLEVNFHQGTLYETGVYLGKYHTFKVALRQTGSKNDNIALATEKAIQHFQPPLILLVGICGGVKDVDLGDVVVATKAYGYESTKETIDGSAVRPDVLPFDAALIDWARHIARDGSWKQRLEEPITPKVVFAPIASGNKVIATTDSPVYRLLKHSYNDTGALEMEAIGFAKAVFSHSGIRAMNIRGVSDLLDQKSESDAANSQEKAVRNALAFVLELLYQLDFKKMTPNPPEIRTIVQKLAPYLLKKIVSSTGQAPQPSSKPDLLADKLWEKVGSYLQDQVTEIRENPDDEEILDDVRGTVKSKLRKMLRENPDLYTDLYSLLQTRVDKSPENNSEVSKSHNVLIGSTINAGGNVKIGNEEIGQQINNNGAIKNQVNIEQSKGDLNFE